jgi:N-acetylglucosaminyldiphosphoundecaprenol N-acetyl-beta-D-mannosaminyltransferase
MNLLGVRISAVDMPTAVARVQAAIAEGRKGYICIRDVHGIIRCQGDAELRQIHNRAFMVTPDGMPVVWALKLAGYRQVDRVYGPDLMLALFDNCRRTGTRHFLYGTTPEILERLQARLLAEFPGAEIVGWHSPPFRELTPDEEADVAAEINASQADIVWIGLGTPKQERWMGRMRELLNASMLVGVGAAFDFHAGVKRQAPRFIQRSGLEWMFRLACEPRRLAWRYMVTVPSFLGLSAVQTLKLRDFPIIE